MKKSFLFALALLVFTPSLVLAVSDENVTKKRPDKPAQVQVQEIRQELQTKREEVRNRITENHALRLTNRFTAYYQRLSNIIARFQTRLDLLTNEGKITTETQVKLDIAKAKLEAAKSSSDSAITAFFALDPLAKDLAISAHDLYKETLSLLKDALKSLKTITQPTLPAAKEAL